MQYFLHTIVSVLSCESSAGKPTSKMKIRLFWFNLIVLKTTLEKANTHPTEESKLIIRYYRESMLGEAQGAHQNYTVKRLFEKDRNSREIKTKRSTRTPHHMMKFWCFVRDLHGIHALESVKRAGLRTNRSKTSVFLRPLL